MSDYTIGIAERIASLPDSTATANSVNRNYFQETSQSVVNTVNVAIVPAAPTALDPTPQTTYATATDEDSVETFGVQETPIVITLLATIEDAGALAQYLIRSVPAYWFSNLAVSLNTLSEANKNIVANLEIGQQIAVTKTFPAGVVPQTVTEYLFVEGISHRVTPETHVVTIYTGPATTFLQWLLSSFSVTTTRTNPVTNPNFETNTTGWATTSTNGARTFVSSTDFAFVGTASGKLTTTGTSGNINASFSFLNVAPSTTYTVSGYVRSSASFTQDLFVNGFTGSGGTGTALGSLGLSQVTSTSTGWTRNSLTFTTPSSCNSVTILFRWNSANIAGNIFYLDAVLFEPTSSALPYFDGTYAEAYSGYTLISQQWNGTANASTSTGVWGLNSSDTGSPLNDSTYGLA